MRSVGKKKGYLVFLRVPYKGRWIARETESIVSATTTTTFLSVSDRNASILDQKRVGCCLSRNRTITHASSSLTTRKGTN